MKVEERVVVNDIAKLQNPTEKYKKSQWDLTLFENIWVNFDVIAIINKIMSIILPFYF